MNNHFRGLGIVKIDATLIFSVLEQPQIWDYISGTSKIVPKCGIDFCRAKSPNLTWLKFLQCYIGPPPKYGESSNSGKQKTLECNLIDDSSIDGAQPKFAKVTECHIYNVGGPEWFSKSGEALTLDIKTKFPEITAAQNHVRGFPTMLQQFIVIIYIIK